MNPGSPEQLVSKLSTDPRCGTIFQLLVHLGHYRYAIEQLREIAFTSERAMSAIHFFYIECAYALLANWFAVKGKKGRYLLRHALTKVGLENELASIDQILDSPIDNTTLRTIVEEFRNAQVTHQIFDGNIQIQLAKKHSLDPESLGETMQTFLDKMYEEISRLQATVETALVRTDPQLYRLLRINGYFLPALP